jgi:hypothetical protein
MPFLHYFGSDSDHLFKIRMPRRGNVPDGAKLLLDSMPGMLDAHFGLKRYFDQYGTNMDHWSMDARMKNYHLKKLQNGKFTMQDMQR